MNVTPPELSDASQECVGCHKDTNVNVYQQWGYSKHFRANVGCYECHEAQKGEKDAFEHEGKYISVIVSPKDCERCHEREVDEFVNSHHAKAGRIMGSLDNILAEVVEGNKAMKTEGFPDGISALIVARNNKGLSTPLHFKFEKIHRRCSDILDIHEMGIFLVSQP